VTAYRPEDFELLLRELTAARVQQHLGDRIVGPVTRHVMEPVATLLFVGRKQAGDTVTTSLHLDAHAKSLSSALLGLVLDGETVDDGTPNDA
jgi:hypothetical protein